MRPAATVIAPVPDPDVPDPGGAIPGAVCDVAAGDPVRPVWANELGGVTFEVGTGDRRRFVKWTPVGSGIDLAAEVARLEWAAPYTPVPRVVDGGADQDGSWIVTAALAGENAVSARWTADPARAVAAIGAGLRALHDALPADGCPFTWSAQDRLTSARRRAADLEPSRWHADHRRLDVAGALRRLANPPAVDRVVVCHGDACAPNTLIDADGRWTGHVDLGDLGVADRWADLAVATWSAGWNYGPGWERALLAAYGVEPDPERTAYYRLLWDLDP